MTKLKLVFCFPILLLALCGCSINVSQADATATPQAQVVPSAVPAVTVESHSQIGNPSLPSTTIPVTWGSLNLSGKLIYTSSVESANSLIFSIQALDLQSGVITTIFQTLNGAWIDFVSVSPDDKQLVMAYLPPRDDPSNANPGQQLLFTMPLDGSKPPQLLFSPPGTGDQYFQPIWSPDGKYIYFSHVDYNAPPKVSGQHYAFYEIYRMAYPSGQPEKLADEAYWPRLSDDGARLAYVTLNPVDGSNQLFIANADGSAAYQVALSGLYVPPIIDAPLITPGDQTILYSAVTPTQPLQPNWVDRLFGITIASAHTVPSDWWSVPLGGGTPTQLTHIATAGLYAGLSPDKKYIVSYSGNGLFIMSPDGTGLTTLVGSVGGLSGTVNWIP